ncbi:Flp family type IVb pilin [Egicoccus sp. AB-alg2]|uniref:Flp family type IVb pilin n=1 Tax=Egicoccus sp. AB-alg2 TaxID=3242693 RepID=UPI00359D867E
MLEKREEGATAVEYSLMAGLIALAIIAAVRSLGTAVLGIFVDLSSRMGWG